MWRYLVPAGLFIALFAFLYFGLRRDKETLPSPLVGKTAPQFELARVENPSERISNRDFAGKPYVLNVWATWCVPCREEHPTLMQIARRGEVPLIGLNWNDNIAAAQAMLRDLGNPYVATAFDGEGRTAIDWGVYGAPETFLVDGTGKIIHKYVGPLSIPVWEEEFVPRIKQAGAGRE